MDDKTKKELMELGVGIASAIAAEALGAALLKMKKEGKLNKKEAERMVRDTIAHARSAGTKYAAIAQSQVSKQVAKAVDASPFATKREIARLNAKIDKLTRMTRDRKRR